MSKAAKTILCFGIYLILLGISMMVIPNILLAIFTIPLTNEVWIRIVGMIVLLLGYIYIRAALNEEGMTHFFRWTVHTRSSVIVFLAIFVLFGFAKPILILFGVMDLLAAAWTGPSLRSAAS